MSVKQKTIIVLCLLVLFMPGYTPAQQQTVAVFPLEDLSRGANSPNMEVTRYIADRLPSKGLKVILEQEVIDFMAANRINWLGYLSTEHVLRAGEDMRADLVLLGTVISSKETGSCSLILNLFRTGDGETVWTASKGLSLSETQRLLGLNQPNTVDELWPVLVDRLLESWPKNLNKITSDP